MEELQELTQQDAAEQEHVLEQEREPGQEGAPEQECELEQKRTFERKSLFKHAAKTEPELNQQESPELDDEDEEDSVRSHEQKRLSYEEVLELRGRFMYRFKGTSMLPLLHENDDLVIIDKRPDGMLNKFDVVLYKREDGTYVLHRIMEVHENSYAITGDNQYIYEEVRDDQIIGVLSAYVHRNKTIPVTDPEYLKYVHDWCENFEMRKFILKARGKFDAIKRKLKI